MDGLFTMHDIYSTFEEETTTLTRNIGAQIHQLNRAMSQKEDLKRRPNVIETAENASQVTAFLRKWWTLRMLSYMCETLTAVFMEI